MATAQRATLTRRSALGVLAGGAGAMLLGCSEIDGDEPEGAESPGGSTPDPGPSPTGEAGPVAGGRLAVGRTGDIQVTDPSAVLGGPMGMYKEAVFERILQYDDTFTLVPALAGDFEIASDYSSVTLELRDGATWHSGRAVTGEDIEWNILRLRDEQYGAAGGLIAASNLVDRVETQGNTVTIVMTEPTLQILSLFHLLYVVDQEWMEGPNREETASGTGPFTFAEWNTGQSLVLDKYDGYWDPERPYLDGLDLTVVGSAQALAVQLESGAVQLGEGLDLQSTTRLLDGTGFTRFAQRTTNTTLSVHINTFAPPFDDVRVRQAVAWALDRELIIETALGGFGEATSVPWPKDGPVYDPEQAATYSFDPDQARDLISQAGADGATVQMILRSAFPDSISAGEILRASLEEIGLTVETQTLDNPSAVALLQESGKPGIMVGRTGVQPDSGASLRPTRSSPILRRTCSTQSATTATRPQQLRPAIRWLEMRHASARCMMQRTLCSNSASTSRSPTNRRTCSASRILRDVQFGASVFPILRNAYLTT